MWQLVIRISAFTLGGAYSGSSIWTALLRKTYLPNMSKSEICTTVSGFGIMNKCNIRKSVLMNGTWKYIDNKMKNILSVHLGNAVIQKIFRNVWAQWSLTANIKQTYAVLRKQSTEDTLLDHAHPPACVLTSQLWDSAACMLWVQMWSRGSVHAGTASSCKTKQRRSEQAKEHHRTYTTSRWTAGDSPGGWRGAMLSHPTALAHHQIPLRNW